MAVAGIKNGAVRINRCGSPVFILPSGEDVLADDNTVGTPLFLVHFVEGVLFEDVALLDVTVDHFFRMVTRLAHDGQCVDIVLGCTRGKAAAQAVAGESIRIEAASFAYFLMMSATDLSESWLSRSVWARVNGRKSGPRWILAAASHSCTARTAQMEGSGA